MDIHVLESDVLSHVLQHCVLEDLEDCTHQWHTGMEGFRVSVLDGLRSIFWRHTGMALE